MVTPFRACSLPALSLGMLPAPQADQLARDVERLEAMRATLASERERLQRVTAQADAARRRLDEVKAHREMRLQSATPRPAFLTLRPLPPVTISFSATPFLPTPLSAFPSFVLRGRTGR